MSARPHFLGFDLLGYGERVINLDSNIADRAFGPVEMGGMFTVVKISNDLAPGDWSSLSLSN